MLGQSRLLLHGIYVLVLSEKRGGECTNCGDIEGGKGEYVVGRFKIVARLFGFTLNIEIRCGLEI
jgi:hypothetical protein